MLIDDSINETRPLNDRKRYRYITLDNGLECLLISAVNEPKSRFSNIVAHGRDRERQQQVEIVSTANDSNNSIVNIDHTSTRRRKNNEKSLSERSNRGNLVDGDLAGLALSIFEEEENSIKRKGRGSVLGSRKNKSGASSLWQKSDNESHRRRSAISSKIKRNSVIVQDNMPTERKSSLVPGAFSLRGGRRLSTTTIPVLSVLETNEKLESNNRRQSIVAESINRKKASVQMAAVSMAVGVGSFAEGDEFHGLAHFLEHMLFMGSKLYPIENEFDQYLARIGGSSNAYTDSERTVYHFSSPQDKLERALDIFAQFFISPTLDKEAGIRELESIEEEFTLRQNDDDCRLLELWRHTSRKETPFSRFTCGNRSTLASKKDKVFEKLRDFHAKYYVGQNMRLVVQGADSIENLQKLVVSYFSQVKSSDAKEHIAPNFAATGVPWRNGDPKVLDKVIEKNRVWKEILKLDEGLEEMIEPGTNGAALGCIFRTIPLQDTHELSLTWQLPPQAENKRSRPTDYVTFLLGHEAEGSILSETKARGWTTGLYASACTMDGFEDNTACTMLNLTIVLTRHGLRQWVFVAGMVFEYIGILLKNEPKRWIMDELVSVYRAQYNHSEEVDPSTRTQDLSVNMLPQWGYAPLNILDLGLMDEIEWDPEKIRGILYQLQPALVRVDLSSTLFRADEKDKKKYKNHDPRDEFDLLNKPITFKPMQEPYTKMDYWVDRIPENVVTIWRELYRGTLSVTVQKDEAFTQKIDDSSFRIATKRRLSLPPRNKYIATDFSIKQQLKPLFKQTHPLIGTELILRYGVKSKSHPEIGHQRHKVVVSGYQEDTHMIVVKYENGLYKWHKLPDSFVKKFNIQTDGAEQSATKPMLTTRSAPSRIFSLLKRHGEKSYSLDDGNITFIITSWRGTNGKEDLSKFETEPLNGRTIIRRSISKNAVQKRMKRLDNIGFPFIPDSAESEVPIKILRSDELVSIWHLPGGSNSSPRSEIRARIISPIASSSAINGALNDLLSLLVTECLRPESFLARVAELDVNIESFDFGQNVKLVGFSDKMPTLLNVVFERFIDFAEAGRVMQEKSTNLMDELISEPVFYAQLESLGLAYFNEGAHFQSSGTLSSALYRVLVQACIHPEDKAYAAESIQRKHLSEYAFQFLSKCKIEVLVTGNLNDLDAERMMLSINDALSNIGSKPLEPEEIPTYTMLDIPYAKLVEETDPWHALSGIVHPLEALEFPGHSIDLFYYVGDDKAEDRVVLMLIEHIMREPLYAELRTRLQLGYMVKCSTVVLHGKVGYVIELTSGKHGPHKLARDVDRFLVKFRDLLANMEEEEFEDHVCALARKKLDNPESLGQTVERHWETIKSSLHDAELKYQWNPHIQEVKLLKEYVTLEMVLNCYDNWLFPKSTQRRRVSVVVFGHGHKGDPLSELRQRSDYITFLNGNENDIKPKKVQCTIC